mgnify:CR=1 FL=1
MYGQAKKAYLNMENYMTEEKPAGKSSGLLGRNKEMQEGNGEDNPDTRKKKISYWTY